MIKALIGAAVALLCVFVGGLFEHKQWRRDRKQEEFRELVTALVAAIMEQQKFIAKSKPGDSASQMFEAQYLALRIVADRIFIRESIKPLKVDEIYIDANEQFTKDRDSEKFSARMDILIHDIVTVAEKL